MEILEDRVHDGVYKGLGDISESEGVAPGCVVLSVRVGHVVEMAKDAVGKGDT